MFQVWDLFQDFRCHNIQIINVAKVGIFFNDKSGDVKSCLPDFRLVIHIKIEDIRPGILSDHIKIHFYSGIFNRFVYVL